MNWNTSEERKVIKLEAMFLESSSHLRVEYSTIPLENNMLVDFKIKQGRELTTVKLFNFDNLLVQLCREAVLMCPARSSIATFDSFSSAFAPTKCVIDSPTNSSISGMLRR